MCALPVGLFVGGMLGGIIAVPGGALRDLWGREGVGFVMKEGREMEHKKRALKHCGGKKKKIQIASTTEEPRVFLVIRRYVRPIRSIKTYLESTRNVIALSADLRELLLSVSVVVELTGPNIRVLTGQLHNDRCKSQCVQPGIIRL